MMGRRAALLLALGLVIGLASRGGAVRVLPAALHVEQAAGSEESYTLSLINDTELTEELRLYIGDWQRAEDGEHDWGVPRNGARWLFDRGLRAGDVASLLYTVRLPETGELSVEAAFESVTPGASGRATGADRIGGSGGPAGSLASEDGTVVLERTVEAIDDSGLATVRLTIRTAADVESLALYEIFSQRVEIESLDSAGARFDTINRSNADWISLSHDRVVLEPSESREIELAIGAPEGIDGTYWSAIFVESQPRIVEQAGTRVLSIYRTAIKVYVTALGSGRLDGRVTAVEVRETAPLAIEAAFENIGTVELVVTGTIEVIDRTGSVIRELTIGEFKVLPGARRVVRVVDGAEAERLDPGIYQAVASFEYGGAGLVVGVRGFRVD